MTTIEDSVHNHIEVEGAAEVLLDTSGMQHLRHIKRLEIVQLACPSVNHTRFEYSLSVYYLASHTLSHPDIEGDTAVHAETAAPLHDVGRGPYSHSVENVTHRHTGKHHDDVEGFVAHGTAGETLEDEGLDPECVVTSVESDGEFGQLISGELDVNRMDYLVRDAHHTGVPYGATNHECLIRELMFVDGELVLTEGNVQAAELLLLARTLMNLTVYQHHVAHTSKAMFRRTLERLLDEDIDTEGLRRMDDLDLLIAFRLTDSASAFAERLATRGLYRRAVWAELLNVPDSTIDAGHDALAAFERNAAAAADVSPESAVLDVSLRPSMTESSSRVMINGEIRQLEREPSLVQALRIAQE